MNISVLIAGLPPVLKPIRLKAKFASSLLKLRLGLVLPGGESSEYYSSIPKTKFGLVDL